MKAIAVMLIGMIVGYAMAQKPAKREPSPVRTAYASEYVSAWMRNQ